MELLLQTTRDVPGRLHNGTISKNRWIKFTVYACGLSYFLGPLLTKTEEKSESQMSELQLRHIRNGVTSCFEPQCGNSQGKKMDDRLDFVAVQEDLHVAESGLTGAEARSSGVGSFSHPDGA